jgi:hypothetical protein
VRVLTIDVASSAQWMNRTAAFFRDPGEHRTYISFIDPVRVLRFMNARRFQIVQLRRNRMMLDRDLEALFEGEVIERDREQRYFYEFDGIRVLLQWPLADDSDVPRSRGVTRSRHVSCRRKLPWRFQPRDLPVSGRRRYQKPEVA